MASASKRRCTENARVGDVPTPLPGKRLLCDEPSLREWDVTKVRKLDATEPPSTEILVEDLAARSSKVGCEPALVNVINLGGSACCSLLIDSLATRISEVKLSIERKSGIPSVEQELVLEGSTTRMDDAHRLCHYVDVLRNGMNLCLLRKVSKIPTVNETTLRRLRRELHMCEEGDGFKLQLVGNDFDTNPLEWVATVEGPSGGPYEGGTFRLEVGIPPDYPYRPPRVVFATKVFHPMVAPEGTIDLDILHDSWSPAITLRHIIGLVQSFLEHPFGREEDPQQQRAYAALEGCGNAEAAALSGDRASFDCRAKEWTRLYASGTTATHHTSAGELSTCAALASTPRSDIID